MCIYYNLYASIDSLKIYFGIIPFDSPQTGIKLHFALMYEILLSILPAHFIIEIL